MAKKGGKREERKRETGDELCDLDNGYTSSEITLRNLSFETVKNNIVRSRYLQLLIALTLIGAILRFVDLGFNSLWLDEATTYNFALKSIPEIWQLTTGGEFNPPLFWWIEHFMLAFGNSEFVLRFVPALAGVLTIPLVYLVGKEFVDRNVGIIAATLCAFSPFLIYYSQEARAYSLGLFFIAFAMVFFLRALKTGDLPSWLLFGILSALALWTHFYTIVVTGSLILYALFVKIPGLKKDIRAMRDLVIAVIVFVIISLPLFLVALPLFASRSSGGPTFGLQGADVVIATFQQLSGFSAIIMYLFLVLFLVGVCQAFLLDRNKGIFLVALMVLPFAISWFLSYKIPMVPRYLIILAPVYFIGIALAYKPAFRLVSNKAIVYGFLVLAVLLSVATGFFFTYYTTYSKEDWKGFSGEVGKEARPGDVLVFVPGYISQPFDYYYSNASHGTFEYGASTSDQLASISARSGNATVYYIVTGDIGSADPSGGSVAWLQEHATGTEATPGIYLFRSAGAGSA